MYKVTGMVLAAVGLLMSGTASAADMYSGSLKDDYNAPVPIWRGLYGGINVGGVVDGEAQFDFEPGVPYSDDTASVAIEGVLAGAHLGYNAQFGKMIVGIEGDAAFGKTDVVDYCPYLYGGNCSTNVGALYSLRARLGVTLRDNLLLYGTGGLALANVEHIVDYGGAAFKGSDTVDGIVYGGGLEYMHRSGVTVGVEALHYDFDAQRFTLINNYAGSNPILNEIDMDATVIRGRVGFHFD